MIFLPGLYCLVQNIFHNFCPTLMRCLGNPAREENPTCGPSGLRWLWVLDSRPPGGSCPSHPTQGAQPRHCSFLERAAVKAQASPLSTRPTMLILTPASLTQIPPSGVSAEALPSCLPYPESWLRHFSPLWFSTFSTPSPFSFSYPQTTRFIKKDPLFIYGVSFYSETTLPICTACHVWS